MLELAKFAILAQLAEIEGIAPSYMARVLRLTLLVPDMAEDTILRSIRSTAEAVSSELSVIGIDDWAWREGRNHPA